MDIRSGSGYPAANLSNFTPHPFEIDGVQCASMEGFLQSLKYKNLEMQEYVCTLVGKKAKLKGKEKKWYNKQILYWQGIAYPRNSRAYQDLLDRAFEALSQNKKFQKALKATGNATLAHSIGEKDPSKTVLTRQEFTNCLVNLRNQLQDK